MNLDPGEYLQSLAADSQAIADMAPGALKEPVPACPGWNVADLLRHLGRVYRMVTTAVSTGEAPQRGDRPPEGDDAAPGWFGEQRAAMMNALTATDPEAETWTFTGPKPSAWWRRRQAMETAIHLWDLQAALGRAGAIEERLAADGVDELVTELLPNVLRNPSVERPTGTVHLHSTDSPGEWMLHFGEKLRVERTHGKGDAALRGPAEGLFLWVWNRVPATEAGLEVFGDSAVVGAWRKLRL